VFSPTTFFPRLASPCATSDLCLTQSANEVGKRNLVGVCKALKFVTLGLGETHRDEDVGDVAWVAAATTNA
jgi:hypothetical protein